MIIKSLLISSPSRSIALSSPLKPSISPISSRRWICPLPHLLLSLELSSPRLSPSPCPPVDSPVFVFRSVAVAAASRSVDPPPSVEGLASEGDWYYERSYSLRGHMIGLLKCFEFLYHQLWITSFEAA